MSEQKVKVKVGTVVESEFGKGPVIALTKTWLIHNDEDGIEICLYLPDNHVWVPADFSEPDVSKSEEVELPVG
jgi:hypothetical protein